MLSKLHVLVKTSLASDRRVYSFRGLSLLDIRAYAANIAIEPLNLRFVLVWDNLLIKRNNESNS